MIDDLKDLFEKEKSKIQFSESNRNGIGTLGEKSLHHLIKNVLMPEKTFQEVPLEGFVADIYDGNEIIEVQSKSFHVLKRKLDTFLKIAPVTIVYPIPVKCYLNWIDPDTGEIKETRISSKHGKIQDAAVEIIRIKSYLKEPGLSFRLFFFEVDDYRLLDGYGEKKKTRATKYDRTVRNFLGEVRLKEPEDYKVFLPDGLSEKFTSHDFRKRAGIALKTAQSTLNLLTTLEITGVDGKSGRMNLYCIK
ncbi:hypothetical protein SAMN05216390_10138 [Lachnospiraceae bacterium KH1T2]|nr:hypothetical protein SAMN05216390_10138 [Lachnospiraceae bacterium KH1T2]